MKTITLVTVVSRSNTTAIIKINDKEYLTKSDPAIDSMPIGKAFLCTVHSQGNKIIVKKSDIKLDNDISLNIIS